MTDNERQRSLCIVVCGAGPAPQVGRLVALAIEAGWTVRIVATPAGVGFLDVARLADLTKTEVRWDFQPSGSRTARSAPIDAIILAPATYNTINKLALGINDTYALNVVAEAIGRQVPVVILPFVNSALASRLPFSNAVRLLRTEGVRVLLGPGQWEPHPPGTGDEQIAAFPWHLALAALSTQ
ncbi:flavoprotein [Dactylosporangium sp. CA-233914]|uniref:flavoprotein n=1 Tax=Dactylosporangium sp. CA-233914 TaxID=3239934 RepID=UPI003D92D99F